MRTTVLDGIVLLIIAAVSFAALDTGHHNHIFVTRFAETFFEILPETGLAALRVWTFWAVAGLVIGGMLLRIEPRLGLLDAALGGFAGVWIFAYLGGNVLGPIGLLRFWTLWIAVGLGALWLWRAGLPRIALHAPSPGQKLAVLTFVLEAAPMLAIQLGSPVPPFMDILSPPAAAQRILTFGRYMPFDNDPYGYWDAASQCPGVELLYALLAIGSHTPLAVLAETAAMLPMAGLLIFGVYRLGRSIGGDVAGGMAALLLFATVFFRTIPYMHGRFVTFALVGVGLGFFLDQRHNPTRLVVGALTLATAVAAHAIIGAFGMAVASATVVFWLLSGDVRSFVVGVALLAGAAVVALPTVLIGLRIEVLYPVLPAIQLLGVVVVVVSARALGRRVVPDRLPSRLLRWGLALLALVALAWRPQQFAILEVHWHHFPLLSVGGGLGLAVMLWLDRKRPTPVLIGPAAAAILIGIGADYVSRQMWTSFADGRLQTAVEDFHHKVDYWNPFVLLFPTACLAAWLYRTVSPRLATFAVLALLFFPRMNPAQRDPNYNEHSIAENWAYHLEIAKGGYWGSTGHRRWAQSAAELEIARILREEIEGGRITPATHVVHITPYILLFEDVALFSVYTGINDDTYVAGFIWDRSVAGGRMRDAAQVGQRLAERPPYIVIHERTLNGRNLYDAMPRLPQEVLDDYEELFSRDGVRLLRSRTLSPVEARRAS